MAESEKKYNLPNVPKPTTGANLGIGQGVDNARKIIAILDSGSDTKKIIPIIDSTSDDALPNLVIELIKGKWATEDKKGPSEIYDNLIPLVLLNAHSRKNKTSVLNKAQALLGALTSEREDQAQKTVAYQLSQYPGNPEYKAQLEQWQQDTLKDLLEYMTLAKTSDPKTLGYSSWKEEISSQSKPRIPQEIMDAGRMLAKSGVQIHGAQVGSKRPTSPGRVLGK